MTSLICNVRLDLCFATRYVMVTFQVVQFLTFCKISDSPIEKVGVYFKMSCSSGRLIKRGLAYWEKLNPVCCGQSLAFSKVSHFVDN